MRKATALVRSQVGKRVQEAIGPRCESWRISSLRELASLPSLIILTYAQKSSACYRI